MSSITNEELYGYIDAQFSEKVANATQPYGLLTVETDRETIINLLTYLKTDPELQFIYLTDLTGIQYPERELSIGVIYHLHSFKHNVRIRIKVFTGGENPHMPSATVLWDGANWMERETYDFFGIIFDGHPDLRRILNVDDMTVFPMRKEYPLEDPNRVDKKDFYFGR